MNIKRLFDLSFTILLAFVLTPIMLVVAVFVRATSKGAVLYWSDRVGVENTIFRMPKFRTMKTGTQVVATHKLEDPLSVLTSIGSFLRKTSLDEIPQLWSILKGDMSLVGPRPALFNQDDLIALRIEKGVQKLLPGITGWAQVNGRDELSMEEKVDYDVEYSKRMSFSFDLKILFLTFLKVIKLDGVAH